MESFTLPGFLNDIPLIAYIGLGVYLTLSILISIFMYFKIKKFFPLDEYTNKSNNTDPSVNDNENLNDKILVKQLDDNNFPEFRRYDTNHFSYLRILFGTMSFAIIRFLIFFALTLLCVIFLTIINCFSSVIHGKAQAQSLSARFVKRVFIFLCIWPMKLLIGVISWHTYLCNNKVREVYSKYFGSDFNIERHKKYSMIISNHHGMIETIHWLIYLTPGFIAKKEIANIPIIGNIVRSIDCLLVDRNDKEGRNAMVVQMKNRQELFYNKKNVNPLLIYPEGTVSSGKYILEFKKGAFTSLMPLKPVFSQINNGQGIYLSPMPFFEHMYFMFCFLFKFARFYELPVIECNEFMLKNHSKEGEKAEDTYARVANLIYQEVFDLKFSNKTYKDLDEYEEICANR